MAENRFTAADAAFRAGRTDEGVAAMVAELERDPNAPADIYRAFLRILARRGRYALGEVWGRVATERFPRDSEFWNLLGISLRRLNRHEEALKVLNQAIKLDPKGDTALTNKGNVLNDLKRGPEAVDVFSKLVRKTPSNAELQRALGRAYWFSDIPAKAEQRLRLAVKLQPNYPDAWLDLSALVADERGEVEAVELLREAVVACPQAQKPQEALFVMLRRGRRLDEARAFLAEVLEKDPNQAWALQYMGQLLGDTDRAKALDYLRQALVLEPDNTTFKLSLAESLSRARLGNEGETMEEAYQIIRKIAGDLELDAGTLKVTGDILNRLGDFDTVDAMGDVSKQGGVLVDAGRHTGLLAQLGRVRTPEDRRVLVALHKRWGDNVLKAVAKQPIDRPKPRAPDGKIRVGFMSSDLRQHPVAYFALPLFEHYDRKRFEIYCYSWFEGAEDPLQKKISDNVTAFRWRPQITDRQAAQMIADDQLDMLIELGGTTHMNKLIVMAFRPAPRQASWLGYPHSAGLTTIDDFILDPYVAPEDPSLILESPLLMPKSWIAMGELAFPERPITEGTPESRNGFLTFGTANNPYKYSKEMIRTWAQITAAVPGAKFMFVRPECGSPSFRTNMIAQFAEEGVPANRMRFVEVRGKHMPFYNEIDISLDTFPQTGGTTTCEALFMGVPVVSLVGPAVFERLSYSILTNAGLGDLCAFDVEGYKAAALKLAGDPERRAALRTGLRATLKASPLGQTEQFARDFYAMIEGAVTGKPA